MYWHILKKKFLSFLLLLALFSCSSDGIRKVEDTPYRTSGIEQFFLPELPGWANASPGGKCFKSNSFQYFDFAKLSGTYQLNYAEMIEVQGQYNQRREDYFRSTAYRFLKPVEEAAFFANTLEQVRGGVRNFRLPKVSEVDVIWLEAYLQENYITELRNMVAEGKFNQKLPILFSSCLSAQRLSQWVDENGFEQVGFYLLSAEWLNPYGSDLSLKSGLRVDISKLLQPETKINILVPQKISLPTELTL